MNEKEALAYANRLREEREKKQISKECAVKRLKSAGILNENGEIKKQYRKALA